MRKILYMLLVIGFFQLADSNLFAQKSKKELGKIALMPRTSNDSILLRWLVQDPELFDKGLASGYMISRADYQNGKWTKFNPTIVVKPWLKKDWQSHLKKLKDTTTKEWKNFSAAYELVANKAANLPSDLSGIKAIQAAKAQYELNFLFSIITSSSDAVTASAMGLSWVDKTVKPGEKYKYKIEIYSTEKLADATEIETAAIPYKPSAPVKVNVLENEASIVMSWKMSEEPFFGYSIERSEDNGVSYKRLNKSIILIDQEFDANGDAIGLLADTSVILYKTYKYRLIGHTLFADEVMFGTAQGMARDRTPVSCLFVPNPAPVATNKMTLKWELTCKPKDLKGFSVYRDDSREGKFTERLNNTMIAPGTLSFVDETFNKEKDNYYLVETYDTAGNRYRSLPVLLVMIDSFPPAAPVWASSSVDSLGRIVLKLKSNNEKDLMGYRLYKANQADHEFSVVAESFSRFNPEKFSLKDTVFRDTINLNSLTRFVYYKATALDRHFNESPFSFTIRITRPDTVKPVSPVLKNIEVKADFLQLQFVPSSSGDVKNTFVYKRRVGNSAWLKRAVLAAKETKFVDSLVETEVNYEYYLQALDTNGNYSEKSFILRGMPFDSGVRPSVKNLKVEYDSDSREVLLNWDYPEVKLRNGEELFFMIYKGEADSTIGKYNSVPAKLKTSFRDADFEKGRSYQYQVKVISNKGAESIISAPVLVKIPE